MKKTYPIFSPSIDRGSGKTRKLLDQLFELRDSGSNEGADEMLSVLQVLADEETRPFINYAITEKSVVFTLMKAFSEFIFASQPKEDAHPVFSTGVASATGGLTACLLANGITDGEVITTSFNFPGVPNAIVMSGATPRFVEIDENDWCMDMTSLESAISEKTRAIVLTHLNKVVDAKPIKNLLAKSGLDIPVIQDASVAMGSRLRGILPGARNVGKGGATVFSFTVSKVLSGFGGAMVVANDLELVNRVNSISYQGTSAGKPKGQFSQGFNIKMNDLNAAIALEQLKRRDELFDKRRMIRAWYDGELENLIHRKLLSLQSLGEGTVITHYAVKISDRAAIAQKIFDEHGVVVGEWPANHLQAFYRQRFGYRDGDLPHTEALCSRITFLPFYSDLQEEDVEHICNALKGVLESS